MKNTTGLKWVHVYRDRTGKVRFYFRRRGSAAIPLPGRPGSREFAATYAGAVAAAELQQQTSNEKNDSLGGYRLPSGPHVYFAKAGDFIKIGYSTRLRQRFKALSTGSAVRLEVLHLMPGTEDLERELHTRFASARANGEWFHAVPSLLQFIDSARTKSEHPLATPVVHAKAQTANRNDFKTL